MSLSLMEPANGSWFHSFIVHTKKWSMNRTVEDRILISRGSKISNVNKNIVKDKINDKESVISQQNILSSIYSLLLT